MSAMCETCSRVEETIVQNARLSPKARGLFTWLTLPNRVPCVNGKRNDMERLQSSQRLMDSKIDVHRSERSMYGCELPTCCNRYCCTRYMAHGTKIGTLAKGTKQRLKPAAPGDSILTHAHILYLLRLLSRQRLRQKAGHGPGQWANVPQRCFAPLLEPVPQLVWSRAWNRNCHLPVGLGWVQHPFELGF